MALQLFLAVALAAGTAADPELCAGTVRETEPQFQIRESDLDHAAALRATERLREMIGKDQVDGEFHFGALNQLKILEGHVLLQEALADRRSFGAASAQAEDSKSSFCNWLVEEGFWYD